MKLGKIKIAAAVAALALTAAADVKLAGPFADGAVLQRGMRVPVWGLAEAGETVTVSFAGQTAKATAGADGRWRVDLKPMEASAEGRVLKAVGDRSKAPAEAKDVLVGEVWFCSGQSNTELPLVGGNPRFRDGKGTMRAQMTDKPLVRYCYQSDYKVSAEPKAACPIKPEWKGFTPGNLLASPSFSAMGVYFALELHSALGVPVGIVGAYWGGTRVEPWTPRSGLLSVAETRGLAEESVLSSAEYAAVPADKRKYKRQQDQPRTLWNEMVAPWTPYAIRGFIWYQGCSNAGEGFAYAPKMHALYNGWAKEFENPDLRLRFVQLAPWGTDKIATIQMAQAKFAAEEPHAKMAVINDLGNLSDIHPNDKETVGQRLAVLSLKYDYGFASLRADSPSVGKWRVENGKFIVDLRDAENLYVYNPDRSVDAGLEVCGDDGVWCPAKILNVDAKGRIPGATLVVSAGEVREPRKLRYLHGRPWFGCIYNEANLPLGAFEIESAAPAGQAAAGRRAVTPEALERLKHSLIHRGDGKGRPDNTMEALLYTWSKGYTPESDIRYTKDGRIVAFHDNILKGRKISEWLWTDLREEDVGSYRGAQYASCRPPLWKTIFTAMEENPERKMHIDWKDVPPEKVAEMVKAHGLEKQCWFITREYDLVKRYKKALPAGRTLNWMDLGNWGRIDFAKPGETDKAEACEMKLFEKAAAEGFKGIDNVQLHCQVRYDGDGRPTFCPKPETLKKCVERLHAAGVEASMCVWQEEANRPETYLELWELGFDSFGTDYPEALYRAVEILRARAK